MDINVGDVLKLKKQHPCGSREWEVLRVGADFRLKKHDNRYNSAFEDKI